MSTGFVRFMVPDDVEAITTVVADCYLVYEDGPDGEVAGDEAAAAVAESRGSMVDLYIDDDEDQPGDPFYRIIEALEVAGAPYLAYHDSYQEKSRGERFRASIAYNTEGTREHRKIRPLDWQFGEPDEQLIERQMANAGFGQADIDEAMGMFFPDFTPGPKVG
jgi:hypothetical protein